MLNVENITFSYKRKGRPLLDDLSLTIKAGGVYGLLGRNGAGKSTLLYLIAGLLTPRSGKVIYKGADTRRRLPATLSDIFIVPEEFTLPPIKFGSYIKANAPFYPRFSSEDLKRHLATFDMSDNLNLGELSMGQKKKAFMSFALACNTSLLLMDEPTNGLDIPGKSAFRRFIAGSMTDERSIVISTHQVRDIQRLIDHVIIMDDSNVIFNHRVIDIVARLKFLTTDKRTLIAKSLYSSPAIDGTTIVLPNDDDTETEINLESLFELALNNKEALETTFNIINSNHYTL